MLTRRVAGSGVSFIHAAALMPERGGIAHRVAAAAHAELSAHRRQRQDRRRGAAAVAVALEAPAAADQRRRRARRTARASGARSRGVDAGVAGRALDRPFGRAGAQPSAPRACSARNAVVGVPVLEQYRCSASATGRSVPGRGARCRSACRASDVARGSIDDELRAGLLRFLDVRHEVDAGRRRVAAPEHDQPACT